MTKQRFPVVIRLAVILFLTSVFICLPAQQQEVNKDFKPQSGQDGKDVVWIPTPQANVNKMLDMAKVAPGDFVIDLGSGDGRTVITAAKRGARGRGIEYNPDMVELSRRNAARAGVADRVEFIQGDLFEADLSEATVITMFLLPSINLKLRPSILELKPGTRIASNSFDMDKWIPDETARVREDCEGYCNALLWIVPAKAEGTWILPQGELTLNQKFQMISGTLKTPSEKISITEGKLNGDQITFNAGFEKYSGRVNGNTIEGIVISDRSCCMWRAMRAGK